MPCDNSKLNQAKFVQDDEYYTRREDVEKCLNQHRDYFKNKTVFLPCDDYRKSEFYKYFRDNFDDLKLKKVIASCWEQQNFDMFSDRKPKPAVFCVSSAGGETAGVYQGDGSFAGKEASPFWKECDIIVTNPPFSLYRDFFEYIKKWNKDFIIIGPTNAITYRLPFEDLRDGVCFVERYKNAGIFTGPNGEEKRAPAYWLIGIGKRPVREPLELTREYNEKDYPKYDNYDAVNVDKTKDIPKDYYGLMGVPVSYAARHVPEQFEIVGASHAAKGFELHPTIGGQMTYRRLFIRRVR